MTPEDEQESLASIINRIGQKSAGNPFAYPAAIFDELGGMEALSALTGRAVEGVNEVSDSVIGMPLLDSPRSQRGMVFDVGDGASSMLNGGAPQQEPNEGSANERAVMDLINSLGQNSVTGKESGGNQASRFAAIKEDVEGLTGKHGSFSKASEGTAARKMQNLGYGRAPEETTRELKALGMQGPIADIVTSMMGSGDPKALTLAAQLIQSISGKDEEEETLRQFYDLFGPMLEAAGDEEGRALKAMIASGDTPFSVRKLADERRAKLMELIQSR